MIDLQPIKSGSRVVKSFLQMFWINFFIIPTKSICNIGIIL